jgi:dinuclear metal center YbgI/SA1388 family protein
MLLRDLLPVLDAVAPLRWAEPWDNVGLLTGDPGSAVTRVLLAIDLTHAVLGEAIAARAELVIAYHPVLFDGIKRVPHDGLVHRAIRAGVAVYSPHTALDVAPGGTNDMLAEALGLVATAPLKVTAPAEGQGIGRVGAVSPVAARSALVARAKAALGLEVVLCAGPAEGDARRAAVCAGAGRGLLDDALAAGVDLYLTGELPHHDALRAAAAGVTVVCALHSNSERRALDRLADRIRAGAPEIETRLSQEDLDPFRFV